MCDTTIEYGSPLDEQLQRVLHNLSTARDDLRVIGSQLACNVETSRAARDLDAATTEITHALRRHYGKSK